MVDMAEVVDMVNMVEMMYMVQMMDMVDMVDIVEMLDMGNMVDMVNMLNILDMETQLSVWRSAPPCYSCWSRAVARSSHRSWTSRSSRPPPGWSGGHRHRCGSSQLQKL